MLIIFVDYALSSVDFVFYSVYATDCLSRDYYREFNEEKNLGFREEDLRIVDNLNNHQKEGFDDILGHVLGKKGQVFFVDGPGGTGKTYLYRALLAKVRSIGHIAIATETPGIAASIMPGGRTAHSRFKIPIKLGESTTCNFTKQSGTAVRLRAASLIIWDKVAMTRREAVKTLDRSLQDIMGCGGHLVVRSWYLEGTLDKSFLLYLAVQELRLLMQSYNVHIFGTT